MGNCGQFCLLIRLFYPNSRLFKANSRTKAWLISLLATLPLIQMATFDPKGKRCFINWENWNYTNQTFSCVSINNRSTNVDFNQKAIDWTKATKGEEIDLINQVSIDDHQGVNECDCQKPKSYKMYVTSMFIFGYLLPSVIFLFSYGLVCFKIRSTNKNMERHGNLNGQKQRQRNSRPLKL